MNAIVNNPNRSEPRSNAVFKISRAIATLWEIASNHLSLRELEWFASGAAGQVGIDVRALSCAIESTAGLMASDKQSGSLQDTQSTAELLFNIQNQLEAIAGLAGIADNASAQVCEALKRGNV